MRRVVILGRGASGKSTLARRLGEVTGLPVIELDKVFWRAGLLVTPLDQWVVQQERLVAEDGWIMDGDLGPYDAVEVRLRAADTIILLDFSLIRCAWRAVRRSRERADFWRWLFGVSQSEPSDSDAGNRQSRGSGEASRIPRSWGAHSLHRGRVTWRSPSPSSQ
jgi:adenylate kinase family enzyme